MASENKIIDYLNKTERRIVEDVSDHSAGSPILAKTYKSTGSLFTSTMKAKLSHSELLLTPGWEGEERGESLETGNTIQTNTSNQYRNAPPSHI